MDVRSPSDTPVSMNANGADRHCERRVASDSLQTSGLKGAGTGSQRPTCRTNQACRQGAGRASGRWAWSGLWSRANRMAARLWRPGAHDSNSDREAQQFKSVNWPGGQAATQGPRIGCMRVALCVPH
jgi:hypothetical protein